MSEATERAMEVVEFDGQVMAIIVSSRFNEPGVHFFTPLDYSQQLGYMSHAAGKHIVPHFHNMKSRRVSRTQEVLFIRKGRLRVDFYQTDGSYIESRVLGAGDVILLASQGHGFCCLDDVEMIEVKQGPYLEQEDKVRMEAVPDEKVVIR